MLKIWYELSALGIIVIFLFENTVTGTIYLNLLQESVMSHIGEKFVEEENNYLFEYLQ